MFYIVIVLVFLKLRDCTFVVVGFCSLEVGDMYN